MKIQINITATTKSISVEENCKFSDLVQFMQTAFPNNWQEFEVNTKVVINYSNPTYVSPYVPYWQQPWYTYTTSGSSSPLDSVTSTYNSTLQNGTYNVDYTVSQSASNLQTEL